MSVPFSETRNPLGNRAVSATDAPVKPFRPAPPALKNANDAWTRLLTLYNDQREWNRAVIIGVLMVLVIAASVIGKAPVTFAILGVFVVAMLLVGVADTWGAILLFIVYLNLEGMFKYTSTFSNIVYAITPAMSLYIFVAWRIGSRAKEAKKQNETAKKAAIAQGMDKGLAFPPVTPLVFAYILIFVVQIFNPESAGLVSATAGSIVWYLAPVTFFFLTYFAARNSKQFTALLYVTIAIGSVTSAYALMQYFLGQEWCYAHIAGIQSVNSTDWYIVNKNGSTESGVFRPVSTYNSPGGYVGVAEFGIIACILVSQMDRMPVTRRAIVLVLACMMAVAMLLSGVRQVLINTVLVGMLTLFLSVRNFKDATRIYFLSFLIVFAGVFAVVAANAFSDGKIGRRIGKVFSDPLASYQKSRGYHFAAFGEALMVRPFGIGIQRGTTDWRAAQQLKLRRELAPLADRETQWNAILSDAGIIGVVLLAVVQIVFLRDGWRIIQRVQQSRFRLAAVFMYMGIVSTFISSFGSTSIQSNFTFWISAGLLYAVPHIYRQETEYVRTGVLPSSPSVPTTA